MEDETRKNDFGTNRKLTFNLDWLLYSNYKF